MEKTFKVIGRDINTNEKINGIGFKCYVISAWKPHPLGWG